MMKKFIRDFRFFDIKIATITETLPMMINAKITHRNVSCWVCKQNYQLINNTIPLF